MADEDVIRTWRAYMEKAEIKYGDFDWPRALNTLLGECAALQEELVRAKSQSENWRRVAELESAARARIGSRSDG